jgi:hypothetical protein
VLDSEGKAKEMMSALADDPDSFAEMVREHSVGEARENGGVIGKVLRGSLKPDLEARVFNAAAGDLLGPFPSADRTLCTKSTRSTPSIRPRSTKRPRSRCAACCARNGWRRGPRSTSSKLVRAVGLNQAGPDDRLQLTADRQSPTWTHRATTAGIERIPGLGRNPVGVHAGGTGTAGRGDRDALVCLRRHHLQRGRRRRRPVVIKSGSVRVFGEEHGKEISMGVRKAGEVFAEVAMLRPTGTSCRRAPP